MIGGAVAMATIIVMIVVMKSGTDQAQQWISIEPGFVVRDTGPGRKRGWRGLAIEMTTPTAH
jgi:hypothetical protein